MEINISEKELMEAKVNANVYLVRFFMTRAECNKDFDIKLKNLVLAYKTLEETLNFFKVDLKRDN
ncbi:MAG: hypothetical protein AABY22_34725 [Nanoarchaeota archaeon]